MVVVARARSINGPWENAPNNPIVRTVSRDEAWLVAGTRHDGPRAWRTVAYLVYHAYENGYWTLGRQGRSSNPVGWTKDGWIEREGFDVGKPIPKPRGEAVPHGFALSDDFTPARWAGSGTSTNGNRRCRARSI
jgi:beta-xylosidase